MALDVKLAVIPHRPSTALITMTNTSRVFVSSVLDTGCIRIKFVLAETCDLMTTWLEGKAALPSNVWNVSSTEKRK